MNDSENENACRFLDQCSSQGKISDSCFNIYEATEDTLSRIRSLQKAVENLQKEPPALSDASRLDLIEHHLKRLDTCVESILTILSKKPEA